MGADERPFTAQSQCGLAILQLGGAAYAQNALFRMRPVLVIVPASAGIGMDCTQPAYAAKWRAEYQLYRILLPQLGLKAQ